MLLAWALLGLVFLPQALVSNLGRPDPLPVWFAVSRNLAIFGLWALFTPVLLAALRRWPPFGPARWPHRLRLLALVLALGGLHVLAIALMTSVLLGLGWPPLRLLTSLAFGLAATNLLMAVAVICVGLAHLHLAGRREAERQLAEARLTVLRQQLQPHFLFNTLNALAELVHRDPELADHLLVRLSALLRRALEGGEARRVSLREELDFLDDYLAIQQALLGERLRVRREIDPGALEALVPPMLLQPLAENALRHGLAPLAAGGELLLRARRQGERLQLALHDDGAGADPPVRDGVGLGNTRARLRGEYGDRARLALGAHPGRGFRVELDLPWESA